MEYTKIIKHQDLIYIYYSKSGKILRYPTGVKVDKKYIDKNGKINEKKVVKYNDEVFYIKQNIEDYIREFIKKNSFSPEKEDILNYLNSNKKKSMIKHTTFLQNYDVFIDEIKQVLKPSTIGAYNSFRISIVNYQIYTKKEMLVSSISIDWYKIYKEFMTNISHTELRNKGVKLKGNTLGNVNNTTLTKRITTLKVFCKWLDDKEILKYPKFLDNQKILKIKKEDPKKEYISVLNIHKLYEMKIKNKKEQKVRDILVFSCFTGLRWGDLIRIIDIQIIEIDNDKYIKDYNKKTEKEIVVPLHKICIDILKKYKYDFQLKDSDNQNVNVVLKKICKKSNLFSGGAQKKYDKNGQELLKYQRISIHTGRHSFITNLINDAVPVPSVMKMTGHTKIDTLQGYLHLPNLVDKKYISIFDKK